jgi:hypothetical protein
MNPDLLWAIVALVAIVAAWDTLRRTRKTLAAQALEERLEKAEHAIAGASERSANALDKAMGAEQLAQHAIAKVTGIAAAPNRWSR